MNKQTIFDKAVNGICKQGKPAIELGSCKYRSGEHGELRCAIGQCIPDDKYSVDFECDIPMWYYEEPNDIARTVGAETEEDVKFLRLLQECHDYAASEQGKDFIPRFLAAARLLASMHDLSAYYIRERYGEYYDHAST